MPPSALTAWLDMVAYLLHWGASLDATDGSRKTALQYAKERPRRHKTKADPANEVILRLLQDEAFRVSYAEDLLVRLGPMREQRKAEFRRARVQQSVLFTVLTLLLFVAAHVLVLFSPAWAEAKLGAGFVEGIWVYSPLLSRSGRGPPLVAPAPDLHAEL